MNSLGQRLVETTQTLERASPYVSTPSSANYAEAKTLYGQGRYVEASEKLRAILTPQDHTSTPFHQEETLLLIRACANQGALDDAIAWCHKAITTDVLNPRFYYLLATVLLEQGREEEAAQALRQTLYLDSEFVLAHFTLGNLSCVKRSQNPPVDIFRTHSHCFVDTSRP
jgi:chemotaxis protein methyltransferase CheR